MCLDRGSLPHGPWRNRPGSTAPQLETHMVHRFRGLVLGAVALFLGSAAVPALGATSSLPPSAFALPRVDVSRAGDPVTLALYSVQVPANVQMEAVRYQPAQQQQPYSTPQNDRPTVSQLHGGYFDASANNTNPFIVGMRVGPMVDKRLQVGLLVDWVHQTKNLAN